MPNAEFETIWRVVFPSDGIGLDDAFRRAAMPVYGVGRVAGRAGAGAASAGAGSVDADELHSWVRGRDELEVPAGRVYSTGCYYNGFPAAYWAKWTTVRGVTLRMEVRGAAVVTVHRSDVDCRDVTLAERKVLPPFGGADAFTPIDVTVPIAAMAEGGWLWFEIEATGDAPAVFRGARWTTSVPKVRALTASLAITTMNKPDWCIRQFRLLAAHADLSLIDAVYVVDQGTDLVADHEGFAEAEAGLGGRLHVIRQGNIGGSGGFARGMYEVERHGDSGYALLLDDDTVLEPESVSRALAFANRCPEPTIVGGNMLFLSAPTRLTALAEVFDRRRVFWTEAPGTPKFDDLAARPFLESRYLHRRVDADYNAWWMCLIPVETIRRIGLSYPFFIKNDDVEYGVRARMAGYRTVTVPGVCLWHMSFVDKDDILDWQAYFHVRNKLIMGLLYSRLPWGGRLFAEMARASMSATIKMRYSAVALHRMAVSDVLAGADHIGAILETRLPQIRAAREAEPDTHMVPLGELPDELLVKTRAQAEAAAGDHRGAMLHQLTWPRRDAGAVIDGYVEPQHAYWLADDARAGDVAKAPGGIAGDTDGAGAGGEAGGVSEADVQSTFDALDMTARNAQEHWSVMGHMDSAVFVNKEKGTGVLLRRRPVKAALGLVRVGVLYARLAFGWRRYQSAYRKAFATMVSPDWWRRYFGEDAR